MRPLIDEDSYTSPDRNLNGVARLFPSLYFYPVFAYLVWRSTREIKNGAYTDERWVESSADVFRLAESVGMRFIVENFSVVKELNDPCVFVGNHMSTLETLILPCMIRPFRRLTFVVKESLLNHPFFRHILRSRNPIAVGRVSPKEDFRQIMDGGVKFLEEKVSVVIFPQTTRTSSVDPKSFNSVGIKLARRAGVPVVPLALKTDAWSTGRFIRDLGRIHPERTVHFKFGDPLRIEGNGKLEHARVVQFITSKLQEWEEVTH